jgi:hypothetical protein
MVLPAATKVVAGDMEDWRGLLYGILWWRSYRFLETYGKTYGKTYGNHWVEIYRNWI